MHTFCRPCLVPSCFTQSIPSFSVWAVHSGAGTQDGWWKAQRAPSTLLWITEPLCLSERGLHSCLGAGRMLVSPASLVFSPSTLPCHLPPLPEPLLASNISASDLSVGLDSNATAFLLSLVTQTPLRADGLTPSPGLCFGRNSGSCCWVCRHCAICTQKEPCPQGCCSLQSVSFTVERLMH